jgi:hypothetical protein
MKRFQIVSFMLILGLIIITICNGASNSALKPGTPLGNNVKIIFLHHSTGECIWNGGVPDWFTNYNGSNGTSYQISERAFPSGDPYPWDNYPYDYWNIWVKHAGNSAYKKEPTLEMLSAQGYKVIIWKHCFPGSDVGPDGTPDIASSEKTIANYTLQYNALKTKMRQFSGIRFIVWTGAALIQSETNEEAAARARQFFTWVKNTWDQPGDNIFVWDFRQLETEGGLYLKSRYSSGDSHPNEDFSRTVAPYFCKRIVDVIKGQGDTGPITGKGK